MVVNFRCISGDKEPKYPDICSGFTGLWNDHGSSDRSCGSICHAGGWRSDWQILGLFLTL